MDDRPAPRIHWFQFRLAHAFVAVLLLAALLTLRQRSMSQHRAASHLKRHGVELLLAGDRNFQPLWSQLLFGDSSLDAVESIKATGTTLSPLDSKWIRTFPSVKNLLFDGCSNIEDALDAESFPDLEQLRIVDTAISERAITNICRFHRLQTLHFINANLKDADLSCIAELPELESLAIDDSTVDDDSIAVLSTSVSIRTLSLARTGVMDDGMAQFQHATQLEHLILRDARITLPAVARLKQLQKVTLQGSAIGDDEIAHLQSLSQLRILTLDATNVTTEGIAALKRVLPDCQVFLGSATY